MPPRRSVSNMPVSDIFCSSCNANWRLARSQQARWGRDPPERTCAAFTTSGSSTLRAVAPSVGRAAAVLASSNAAATATHSRRMVVRAGVRRAGPARRHLMGMAVRACSARGIPSGASIALRSVRLASMSRVGCWRHCTARAGSAAESDQLVRAAPDAWGALALQVAAFVHSVLSPTRSRACRPSTPLLRSFSRVALRRTNHRGGGLPSCCGPKCNAPASAKPADHNGQQRAGCGGSGAAASGPCGGEAVRRRVCAFRAPWGATNNAASATCDDACGTGAGIQAATGWMDEAHMSIWMWSRHVRDREAALRQ